MKAKYLWIAALCGAVVTTLVSNVPVIDFVNFLLCAGFWGSAAFAVWLYRRLAGTLTLGQAAVVGTLAGALAGGLGFAISFLGLAGLQGIVNEIRFFAGAENAGNLEYSIEEAIAFNTVGVMINILCGAIGGLIGGAVLRTDRDPARNPAMETA
jgi:hypothetical protein